MDSVFDEATSISLVKVPVVIITESIQAFT